MQIQVLNEGLGAARRVNIYPDVLAPFLTKPGTINQTAVAELRSGASVVSDFSFSVDSGVPAGVYKIKFYAAYLDANNQAGRVSIDVPVNVQGTPLIEIIGSETSPVRVPPGGSGSLHITIKNIGTDVARNVRAAWAANATIPIQPSGGGVSYVEGLKNDGEKTLSIDFIVDGDARSGNYPVPLAVSYHDAQHSEQAPVLRSATIIIEGRPELRAYVSEGGTFTAGKTGKMTITVANTGSGDARFLFAKLIPSGVSVSPQQSYLKTISPNKDDSLDVDVAAEKAGRYSVRLQLIYKDQYNADVVSEEAFEVVVSEPTRASKTADFLEEWKYPLFALVVLIALLYFLLGRKEGESE